MSSPAASVSPLGAYLRFDGPDWRSQRAATLRAGGTRRQLSEADGQIRQLYCYLELCARGDSQRACAQARYPATAAACALAEDEVRSSTAKILALAGCPAGEIAQRVGADEQTVTTWEDLFFDVRGGLDAVGWIDAHIIQAALDRGNELFAAKLKAAAAGGPEAARAVLDLDSREPLTVGQHLFDRQLKLALKADAAAELPLESIRDKQYFTKLYAKIREEEVRLKLAQGRYQQFCHQRRDQHELAKIREETAQQRIAHKAAQQAQAQQDRQRREADARAHRAYQAASQERYLREEQQAAAARAAASPLSRLSWALPATPASGTVASEAMETAMAGAPLSASPPTRATAREEPTARGSHAAPPRGDDAPSHLDRAKSYDDRAECQNDGAARPAAMHGEAARRTSPAVDETRRLVLVPSRAHEEHVPELAVPA